MKNSKTENNKTKQSLGVCKNCGDDFLITHGLMKFCSPKCKNDFHNAAKKEHRLEVDYWYSKMKKDEVEEELKNMSIEKWKENNDLESRKADNQILLKSWDIPDNGREVTIEFLIACGFDLKAYDQLVPIRQSSFNIAEYGDYGLFWVGIDKILITNKKDYILWN